MQRYPFHDNGDLSQDQEKEGRCEERGGRTASYPCNSCRRLSTFSLFSRYSSPFRFSSSTMWAGAFCTNPGLESFFSTRSTSLSCFFFPFCLRAIVLTMSYIP